MPKKSSINIFNVMSPDELHEKIKEGNCSIRYFKRLMVMRLIEEGLTHKKIAEIVEVSYRSVNRWAHACEKDGLTGLEPDFTPCKKSKLTPEKRESFKQRLMNEKGLTMTDAKKILEKEYGIEFSLGYVGRLVKSLGFNYGSPRPKYREASENPDEELKKTSQKVILNPTTK